MKIGLNKRKFQILQMMILSLNNILMTLRAKIYSLIIRRTSLFIMMYQHRQLLMKRLYLQRKFQVRKKILKFKDKVQSQFCLKMSNAYLRRIKSLLLMKIGFVIKRNFRARRMR